MVGTGWPLTRAEQRREDRRVADDVLRHYDIEAVRLTRMRDGWNATFRVDTDSGERFALRVHRTDGHPYQEIEAELAWLRAIARDTDLVVPEPVPTRDGDLIAVDNRLDGYGARQADLLRWVDGRFVVRALQPRHLHRVGVLMAALQEHGRTQPRRPRRRVDDLLPTVPESDPWADEVIERAVGLVAQHLDPQHMDTVHRVADRYRRFREAPGPSGLMHGDLHHENFLFHQGEARAIDFDDCGYGPYLYDLAVTLSELRSHPRYADLRPALLAGYRSRQPLEVDEAVLDELIAFRYLQLTLYVVEHRADPKFANWYDDSNGVLDFLARWPA